MVPGIHQNFHNYYKLVHRNLVPLTDWATPSKISRIRTKRELYSLGYIHDIVPPPLASAYSVQRKLGLILNHLTFKLVTSSDWESAGRCNLSWKASYIMDQEFRSTIGHGSHLVNVCVLFKNYVCVLTLGKKRPRCESLHVYLTSLVPGS